MRRAEQGNCFRMFRTWIGFKTQRELGEYFIKKKMMNTATPTISVNRWEKGTRRPSELILSTLARRASAQGFKLKGGASKLDLLRSIYEKTMTLEEWEARFESLKPD